MSRVTFNRKRVKLKKLLGIRARLVLLAMILVAPLMLERARSLENMRAKQIAQATQEFSSIARQSVQAQREIISSVETMMKSAAYIRASAGGVSRSCDMLRASMQVELPWIRSMSIVAGNGRVQCSTLPGLVGVDLSDRAYLSKAVETHSFVFSDYIVARAAKLPIMTAAYPVSAIAASEDAVIVAGINLDWMSKIMGDLGGRPGVSAVLIDSEGTVIAAPSDQASMIGRPLDNVPLPTRRSVRTSPRDRLHSSPPMAQNATSASPAFPAPDRAWWSASTRRGLPPAPTARFAPPICNWLSCFCSCCSAP
jgi:hypothetical protein